MENYKRIFSTELVNIVRRSKVQKHITISKQQFLAISELEDKISDNLCIFLPCKVGDTVYYIDSYSHEIEATMVIGFNFSAGNREVTVVAEGEKPLLTFYLTKEEAQKAMEEQR